MKRAELLQFLRRHRICVETTVSGDGAPQAAVVGYAVTSDLEIVFDTLDTTRKLVNLRRDPRVALVVGWDEEQTLQLQGLADEPQGEELTRLKEAYFDVYPDGIERQAWKGITIVRVRPTWARYSDFRPGGAIVEISEAELGRPSPGADDRSCL
jgi:PPOX class probable F420-dependent enzyme